MSSVLTFDHTANIELPLHDHDLVEGIWQCQVCGLTCGVILWGSVENVASSTEEKTDQ